MRSRVKIVGRSAEGRAGRKGGTWVRWLGAALLLGAFVRGSGQDVVPPEQSGHVTLLLHGAHRSNALHNGLAATFIRGGWVEDGEIQRALDRGRNRGRLGVEAGTELVWTASGNGPRWCGRAGFKNIADARWSPDALELAFFGNQQGLGTYEVLNGTSLRVGQWVYAGVGRAEGWRGFQWEALVYQSAPMLAGRIDRGYLFVSEGADSLYAELEGSGFRTTAAGWGAGLGASWSWMRPDGSLYVWAQLSHLGAVRYQPGTVRTLAVDTLVETTGLALSGPGLTWEGVQSAEFREGWAQVDSLAGRWVPLPTSLEAGAFGNWGRSTRWRASAAVGDWMPWPLVTLSVLRQVGNRGGGVGAGVRAGGWGWVWPYAHATIVGKGPWFWAVSWEDPLAVGPGNGLGRGLTLVCSLRI